MFLRFQGTFLIIFSLFIGLSGFASAPVLAQESYVLRDGGEDPTGGGIDDRYTYDDGGDRKCEVKVDDLAWDVGPPDPGAPGPFLLYNPAGRMGF